MVIHRGLGDPTELIMPESGRLLWSGMLTIEAYGQWLLRELRFDVEDAYRAVAQALPYALKQVLIMLRPPKPYRKDRLGSRNLERTLSESAAYPFANDSVVSQMLSRTLGITEPTDLLTLENGLLIADLPLFRLQIQKEKEACVCTKSTYTSCKVRHLWENLATFVADILLLSLFTSPERLLVQLNTPRIKDEKLNSTIRQLLISGQPAKCNISDILDAALALVGHRVSKELRDCQWVISCHKGQVVYPRVFETQLLDQNGYLTLSWAPGKLSYEGITYTQGICRQDSYNSIDESVMFETGGVDRPRNLSLNQSLVWRVAHGDGILHVNIAAQFDSSLSSVLCWPPFRLLTNLSLSFILASCPHDATLELEKPDPWCRYTSPLRPLVRKGQMELHTGKDSPYRNDELWMVALSVVAVDGNDGLRMVALSACDGPFPILIRKNACLSCCLEFCRRASCAILIC